MYIAINVLHILTDLWQVTEDKVTRLLQREAVCEGLQKQQQVYEEVQANLKKTKDKVRKRKLKEGHEENFKVEDLVLLKNKRLEQRKGKKLEADMVGPLKITKI